FVSGSTTEVAGVPTVWTGCQGYSDRDSSTWYLVAPTTGFQATIGALYTTGVDPVEAMLRLVGPMPETNGRPAEGTIGCETLPKLITLPAGQESCGTAVSKKSPGMLPPVFELESVVVEAVPRGVSIVTGTTVQ